MVAILVAIPTILAGNPWLVLYQNSQSMLLYNHEVQYSSASQTIAFFNPASIHTFFPLSYIFARVFYVIVPYPLLVEFVSPAVISAILLSAFCAAWMKRSPKPASYLAMFGAVSFVLFYITDNQWLWFRSVGGWELIVFLTLFASFDRVSFTNHSAIMALPIVAIVLGDDGVFSFAAITFLLAQYAMSAKRNREHLVWAGIFSLCVIAYELAVGFVGESYYGRYLPVLRSELSDLLNFNLQFSGHVAAVGLPEFQTVGSATAFFTMFGILPLLLLWNGLKNGLRRRDFVIPGFLLVSGVAFRVSNTISATAQYVGALYVFVLFVFLPASIFALIRVSDWSGYRGRGAKYTRTWKTMAVTIFVCALVLSTFQLNPIVPHGQVQSVSDARVRFVYLQASGVFASQHDVSPIAVAQVSDLSTLFVNPPAPSSDYLLTSTLPSPFAQRPVLGSEDLLYSNGPMILVARH